MFFFHRTVNNYEAYLIVTVKHIPDSWETYSYRQQVPGLVSMLLTKPSPQHREQVIFFDESMRMMQILLHNIIDLIG